MEFLDFRKPTDTVIIVSMNGLDLPGAEFLHEDGTFRKSRATARQLLRPEAEKLIEAGLPEARHRRLTTWIV
jgi:hypothetical protein